MSEGLAAEGTLKLILDFIDGIYMVGFYYISSINCTIMAKAKGILRIVGTIGGITFYESKNGGYLARGKGGFDGEAIKNKASHVRVRENYREFGNCSSVAKHFRKSMGTALRLVADGKKCARTVKLMTDVMKCDSVSGRGERVVANGIETAEGKEFLRGFELSSVVSLQQLLLSNYVLNVETGGVLLPGFQPARDLRFPSGATEAGLQMQAVVFDFESEFLCYNSELAFVRRMDAEGDLLLLPEGFEGAGVLTGGVCFFVLYVRFYVEEAGERLQFFDEKCCGARVLGVV